MSRGNTHYLHGEKFDSTIELDRYIQLFGMYQDGEISDLKCHPTFELQPRYVNRKGKVVRPITYTADFQYVENGVVVVEDVKARDRRTGKARNTREGRLRNKMLEYQNPHIDFRIVMM